MIPSYLMMIEQNSGRQICGCDSWIPNESHVVHNLPKREDLLPNDTCTTVFHYSRFLLQLVSIPNLNSHKWLYFIYILQMLWTWQTRSRNHFNCEIHNWFNSCFNYCWLQNHALGSSE